MYATQATDEADASDATANTQV